MKNNKYYIDELESFGENLISENKVKATSGKKGSLKRLSSYLENYQKNVKSFETDINQKMKSLLEDAKEDTDIDIESLKSDLMKSAENIVGKFLSDNKKPS